MKWASFGQRNADSAIDALRTLVCLYIKATDLILQTFSDTIFSTLYAEKLSAQGFFFHFFLCITASNYFLSSISEVAKLPYCLLLTSIYQQQLSFLDSC